VKKPFSVITLFICLILVGTMQANPAGADENATAKWNNFQFRVFSQGVAVSNAKIGINGSCCAQADSSGNYSVIGKQFWLTEGKYPFRIYPTGREIKLAAPSLYWVYIVDNQEPKVVDKDDNPVPIENGVHVLVLESPNLVGTFTMPNNYKGSRIFAQLSGFNGQTDQESVYSEVSNQYGYLIDSKREGPFVPYLMFQDGATRRYAMGPICRFVAPYTQCLDFAVNPPNLKVRMVSSSGTPLDRLGIYLSPIVESWQLNGLTMDSNSDLRFYASLADGVYWLNSTFELQVKQGRIPLIFNLQTGAEYQVNDGEVDLPANTGTVIYNVPTRVVYKLETAEILPGGASFRVLPLTGQYLQASFSVIGDPAFETTIGGVRYTLEKPASIDSSGLILITGLKFKDRVQVILRDAAGHVLTHSAVVVIDKLTDSERAKQEAEAKAAADKAAADAAAKAAADLKAKQEAEAKVMAKAAQKKTTITCVRGKLTKKVTAIKPKCPAGYKVKK